MSLVPVRNTCLQGRCCYVWGKNSPPVIKLFLDTSDVLGLEDFVVHQTGPKSWSLGSSLSSAERQTRKNMQDPETANKLTGQWWFNKFCKGDKSLQDERSGQPREGDKNQLS